MAMLMVFSQCLCLAVRKDIQWIFSGVSNDARLPASLFSRLLPWPRVGWRSSCWRLFSFSLDHVGS